MTPETRSYPRLLYNTVGGTKTVGSYDEEMIAGPTWQCGPDGKPSSSALYFPSKKEVADAAKAKADAEADAQAKADEDAKKALAGGKAK